MRFVGSSILDESICWFSLSFLTVNDELVVWTEEAQ